MTTVRTVTVHQIERILGRAEVRVTKIGEKTALVHVTLKNGFEMTETAACVDPANYDQKLGEQIAMKKITDRLWQLEGWRLQCELHGDP